MSGKNINQTYSAVNSPTQRQLLTAAVYGYLVYGGALPDLTTSLNSAIMRAWSCDQEVISTLPVCGYPNRIQNLIMCMHASEIYGDLSQVQGFYAAKGCYWLDLNEKWSATGFIVPVTHKRFGFYSGLLAFRSPKDQKPFMIQVSGERKAAA